MDRRKLLDEFTPLIELVAHGSHVPGMEFDDLKNELSMHLFKCKLNFRGKNGSSLKTYIRRILNNKVRDLAKSAHRKPWIGSGEDSKLVSYLK